MSLSLSFSICLFVDVYSCFWIAGIIYRISFAKNNIINRIIIIIIIMRILMIFYFFICRITIEREKGREKQSYGDL